MRFWSTEGSAAFFMGYRPSYLVCRSLFRALREPAALAMLTGYAGAAIRREDRLNDRQRRRVSAVAAAAAYAVAPQPRGSRRLT